MQMMIMVSNERPPSCSLAPQALHKCLHLNRMISFEVAGLPTKLVEELFDAPTPAISRVSQARNGVSYASTPLVFHLNFFQETQRGILLADFFFFFFFDFFLLLFFMDIFF